MSPDDSFAGFGSEIRRPVGYAIPGGLPVSRLLTSFTTPVVRRARCRRIAELGPPE